MLCMPLLKADLSAKDVSYFGAGLAVLGSRAGSFLFTLKYYYNELEYYS